jgi:hypothetical protein
MRQHFFGRRPDTFCSAWVAPTDVLHFTPRRSLCQEVCMEASSGMNTTSTEAQDFCHFSWCTPPVRDDFTFSVRLTILEAGVGGGIMIRRNLSPSSTKLFIGKQKASDTRVSYLYRSKKGGSTYCASPTPSSLTAKSKVKKTKEVGGKKKCGFKDTTSFHETRVKKEDVGEAEDAPVTRNQPGGEESKSWWLRVRRQGSCFVAFVSDESKDANLAYTGRNDFKFNQMKAESLQPSHWLPLGETIQIADMDGPVYIGLAASAETKETKVDKPLGVTVPLPTHISTATFRYPWLQIHPTPKRERVRHTDEDNHDLQEQVRESKAEKRKRRLQKSSKICSGKKKKENVQKSPIGNNAEMERPTHESLPSSPKDMKEDLNAKGVVEKSDVQSSVPTDTEDETNLTTQALAWESCHLGQKSRPPQLSSQEIFEWYPSETRVVVKPAPEPSSIEWENIPNSSFRYRLLSSLLLWVIFVVFLLVLFSIGVFVGRNLSSMERTAEHQRICDTEVFASHFGTYHFRTQVLPKQSNIAKRLFPTGIDPEMGPAIHNFPFILVPEVTQVGF